MKLKQTNKNMRKESATPRSESEYSWPSVVLVPRHCLTPTFHEYLTLHSLHFLSLNLNFPPLYNGIIMTLLLPCKNGARINLREIWKAENSKFLINGSC